MLRTIIFHVCSQRAKTHFIVCSMKTSLMLWCVKILKNRVIHAQTCMTLVPSFPPMRVVAHARCKEIDQGQIYFLCNCGWTPNCSCMHTTLELGIHSQLACCYVLVADHLTLSGQSQTQKGETEQQHGGVRFCKRQTPYSFMTSQGLLANHSFTLALRQFYCACLCFLKFLKAKSGQNGQRCQKDKKIIIRISTCDKPSHQMQNIKKRNRQRVNGSNLESE